MATFTEHKPYTWSKDWGDDKNCGAEQCLSSSVSLWRQQQQPGRAFYGGTHKWSAWFTGYSFLEKVSWLKCYFSFSLGWRMNFQSSKPNSQRQRESDHRLTTPSQSTYITHRGSINQTLNRQSDSVHCWVGSSSRQPTKTQSVSDLTSIKTVNKRIVCSGYDHYRGVSQQTRQSGSNLSGNHSDSQQSNTQQTVWLECLFP